MIALRGDPTLEEMRTLQDTSAATTTPLSRKAPATPPNTVPANGEGTLTRVQVLAMIAGHQASRDAIRAICH